MPSAFDVEAARKAGYGDDEILAHLTESRKFDVQGALKSGYSKQDVIDHLSSASAPSLAPATPAEQPGAVSRFFSSLGEMLNPVPAIKDWLNRPSDFQEAAHGFQEALRGNPKAPMTAEQASAVDRGNAAAARIGTADSPAVLQGTEPLQKAALQVGQGDLAGAAGTVTGGYGPAALLSHAPMINKRFSSSAVTLEQSRALQFAEQRGIPVDPATATQNKFLQGSRAILEKQPGTAGPLGEFRKSQEAALASTGAALAEEAATGAAKTKVTAGTNVVDALKKRVDELHEQTNTAYSKLREIANDPANVQEVQTGTKPFTGANGQPLLDVNGQPITVPVTEKIAAPTSYDNVKASLKPLLARLERQIPEAQKQASPGLQALRQIMDRPGVVDLDTAMSDLSAIQNIARNDVPALRNVSQGLASYVTKPLRAAVDQAAGALGPEAMQALNEGRALTAQKKNLAVTLKAQLKSEPVRIVNRLIANEDAGNNLLQTAARETPEVLPDVARATLERILENATAKGGFKKVDSTFNMWSKLGPQTKATLFGAEKAQQLDQFFEAARLIGENPNPSGSATVGSIGALAGLAIHSPLTALATLAGSRKFADFLMQPNGTTAATRGLTLDLRSAGGKSAALNLLMRRPGTSSEDQ